MTGAIFWERRPATIIRSACRGDGRKTSAPKRATSKRAAAIDIISMAQQARPNPSGQMELRRAQFTALSSVVKIMPSSSRSLPKSSGLERVACLPRDVLIVPRLRIFSHIGYVETNHAVRLSPPRNTICRGTAPMCPGLQAIQRELFSLFSPDLYGQHHFPELRAGFKIGVGCCGFG